MFALTLRHGKCFEIVGEYKLFGRTHCQSFRGWSCRSMPTFRRSAV